MQVYYSESDKDSYARQKKDPDEVLRYLADNVNPWAYGQSQKLIQRMTLRVPGVPSALCACCNDAGYSGLEDSLCEAFPRPPL